MKEWDESLVAAVSSGEAHIVEFVRLHDSDYSWDLRVTAENIPRYLDHGSGEVLYSPVSLLVEPTGDVCKVTLDNVDQAMTSDFLSEDRRGSTCEVYLGAYNTALARTGFDCQFKGEIDKIDEITRSKIVFTVVGPLGKWNRYPLHRHSIYCRWTFKSAACGYSEAEWTASTSVEEGYIVVPTSPSGTICYIAANSGTTSGEEPSWDTDTGSTTVDNDVNWTCLAAAECDKSIDTCTILENEDNFGGFVWLPDIMTKSLKWEVV